VIDESRAWLQQRASGGRFRDGNNLADNNQQSHTAGRFRELVPRGLRAMSTSHEDVLDFWFDGDLDVSTRPRPILLEAPPTLRGKTTAAFND
jgi:hypothetical protein